MAYVAPRIVLTICVAACVASAANSDDTDAHQRRIVQLGEDGVLKYRGDEQGNVIPDFSHAGYRGGGVALPTVAVKITLQPSVGHESDDTARIQAALDKLAGMPLDEDGFRGALLLKSGRYRLTSELRISANGIVMRGEGQHPGGTVIQAYGGGKYAKCIALEGTGEGARFNIDSTEITQGLVPVGSRKLTVEDATKFKVGDQVVVVRRATPKWLEATRGNQLGWTEKGYTYRYERTITKVQGSELSIDIPVVEPIDKSLGGGVVCKYNYPGRLNHVGIEYLRFEGDGGQAIAMDHVENVWVKNVTTIKFMYSTVSMWYGSKNVTVQDCAYLDPVGPIKGGYRYGFNCCGQLCLVQRCYARNGRHDFVMHLHGKGPNVFLDCLADEAHSDSGPHHRWSVATLYDNVAINGNGLTAKYAGSRGTGHGWTGVQMVFYNCMADYLNIQDPPIGQNYCIGCKGKLSSPRYRGTQGYWESYRHRVEPRSLYLAQLADRLGQAAVDNVTTPSQRSGTIRTELREGLGE